MIFCRVTILPFPLSFRLHFLLNYHRLPLLPVQHISIGNYRLRDKTDSVLTDVRKVSNCSSSFGIKATVEESSQTSSYNLWHFSQVRNNRVNWKHTFGGCVWDKQNKNNCFYQSCCTNKRLKSQLVVTKTCIVIINESWKCNSCFHKIPNITVSDDVMISH